MIIGDKGPLTQTQVDKMEADAKETKRIKTLSTPNIIGEIRQRMKTENLLGFAVGLGVLALLNTNEIKSYSPAARKINQLRPGNDPYCLSKPKRPKMGRMRKGKVAAKPTPVAKESATKELPVAA